MRGAARPVVNEISIGHTWPANKLGPVGHQLSFDLHLDNLPIQLMSSRVCCVCLSVLGQWFDATRYITFP